MWFPTQDLQMFLWRKSAPGWKISFVSLAALSSWLTDIIFTICDLVTIDIVLTRLPVADIFQTRRRRQVFLFNEMQWWSCMTVERLCPKSAKSTRYFHAERISHWLIASFLVIDMMILQVEDYFQEEEEEYDFWADYADYSDEDGQTNQVCLLTSSSLSLLSSSFLWRSSMP